MHILGWGLRKTLWTRLTAIRGGNSSKREVKKTGIKKKSNWGFQVGGEGCTEKKLLPVKIRMRDGAKKQGWVTKDRGRSPVSGTKGGRCGWESTRRDAQMAGRGSTTKWKSMGKQRKRVFGSQGDRGKTETGWATGQAEGNTSKETPTSELGQL